MNRSLLWRGITVLVVVVGSILLAYPPEEKINLGLDLRGGVYLVLDVQADEALRAETEKDSETLVRQLGEDGVSGVTVRRVDDSRFEAIGVPAESRAAVETVIDSYLPVWSFTPNAQALLFTRRQEEDNDIREQAVQAGRADHPQPHRRLRRLRAGDPAPGPRLEPHRVAAPRASTIPSASRS